MNTLNPRLYEALRREFKRVRITNAGMPMVATYFPGWDGRLRKRAISSGEYFQISCPFCTDARFRLWINHRWGTRDPKTGSMHRWAAICFNEDCLRDENNRIELIRRTSWYHRNAAAGRVELLPGRPQEEMGKPIPLPRDYVRLDALAKDHPARQYVVGRRFDPDRLARLRGVGFSERAFRRLVIPIFAQGPGEEEFKCWGWQGRAIAATQRYIPKYFTSKGLKKSCLLYGLELAVKGDGPVLVCEGPTDVWRAGKNAVALLGKTASTEQVRLLRKHLRGRPLVVALDPDAERDSERLVEVLRSARSQSVLHPDSAPVVKLRLPKDSDPCDLTRKKLWQLASKALARLKS